jgi:hypothetical protein
MIVRGAGTTGLGSLVGSNYTGITGLIQTGRGPSDASLWDGTTGIFTSSAPTTLNTLGVALAQQARNLTNPTDTVLFDGETVTGNDVLVKFTYGGDANLDGKINIDDYGHIDTSIGIALKGYFNGDFNYDGVINIDDYGIIDVNIGIQGGIVL